MSRYILPRAPTDYMQDCVLTITQNMDFKRVVYAYETRPETDGLIPPEIAVLNVNMSASLHFLVQLNVVYDLYFITLLNVEMLENFLSNYQKTKYWNAQAKVIIVMHSIEQIETLFEIAWKYFLINVVVINEELEVYRYYPLKPNECGSTTPTMSKNCNSLQPIVFNQSEATSFRGCTVRTMVFQYVPYIILNKTDPGVDISIMLEVARHLDFKLVFLSHNHSGWGYYYGHGNFTEIYQELADGNIDIILSVPCNATIAKHFDYSTSDNLNDITFWVPTALPIAPNKKLLLVFGRKMWASLLITTVTLMISLSVLRSTEIKSYKKYSYCALNCWRILFSAPHIAPRTRRLKLVFFMWVCCCIIIDNSFQGALVYVLFKPLYHKPIKTLKDLINSGISYGGHPQPRELLYAQNTSITNYLAKNYQPCKLDPACMNRAAEERKFAIFRSSRVMNYIMGSYLHPNGRPKMQPIDVTWSFVQANYMRKGLPMLGHMKEIMRSLRENGIIARWDVYFGRKQLPIERHAHEVLSFQYLAGAFVLLVAGLVASLIAFGLEIVYSYIK